MAKRDPLEEMVGAPQEGADEDDGAPVADGGSAKAKKRRAMKRMAQAFKAGDWDDAAEAFRDAFEACEEYEDETEAEGDEGDGYEGDDGED